MAATYTAYAASVTLPTTATNTTLLALYNLQKTKSIYISRIWMINTGTTVVTGVYQTLTLGKFTIAPATTTAVALVKHDSSSTTLTAGTDYICVTKPTAITIVDILRNWPHDGDEYITNISKMGNLLGLPNFGLLWDSGYGDTNVKPLTLNYNEGVALNSAGVASGVGTVDVIFEFYNA